MGRSGRNHSLRRVVPSRDGVLGPAAENRLPPAGRRPQDPAMSMCDARLPLPLMSAAALVALVQQQPGRHRRRDTVRP
jgi:hypothetical protein